MNFLKKLWSKRFVRYAVLSSGIVVVNTNIFSLLCIAGLDYRFANIIAILAAKILTYFICKLLVFRTRTGFIATVKEMIRFIWTRVFSIAFDFIGVAVAVDVLHADKIISKYVILSAVVLMNYFIGKSLVFKQGGSDA